MLTITRKREEELDLFIGGELIGTVKVLKTTGSKVKLGLNGIQDLKFLRREVTERIAPDQLDSLRTHTPSAA